MTYFANLVVYVFANFWLKWRLLQGFGQVLQYITVKMSLAKQYSFINTKQAFLCEMHIVIIK